MKIKPKTKVVAKAVAAVEVAATQSILAQADVLINGQRQKDYGDKLSNFTQIAMLFSGVLARKLLPTAAITPDDVALLMMQVKIARLANTREHKDSILDIAGYVGCLDKLQEEREAFENPDLLPADSLLTQVSLSS
jgi:hypothetical protein